jgi:signal transduction histidine kinase
MQQAIQLQALYPRHDRNPMLALLAIAAIGVALRRHLALATVLVGVPLLIGLVWSPTLYPDTSGAFLAGLVMLYTISRRSRLALSLLALGVELVAIFLARRTDGVTWTWLIQAEDGWIFLAWFAGRAQASRDTNASRLRRMTHELAEERDRLTRGAVATERARIAAELHSIVVKNVERMRIGAHRARAMLVDEPVRAATTIAGVERTGRVTLLEMRRALTLLRMAPSNLPSVDADDGRSSHGVADPGSVPMHAVVDLVERVRRDPRAGDLLVVGVFSLLAIGEPFMVPWKTPLWPFLPVAGVLVGTLWFRRVAPATTLALIAAIVLGYNVFGQGDPYTADRAFVVALFTLATIRGPRWALVGVAIELAVYAPLLLLPGNCDVSCQAAWLVQTVLTVIAGLAIRESGRIGDDLQSQAAVLRRTREESARMAVVEERLRVARDVHDLVAHAVTLMVIKAGAARWVAPTDSTSADVALRSIDDEGRAALVELHTLLHALGGPGTGPDDEPLILRPTSMRAIVASARRDGLDVSLDVSGKEEQISQGMELSLGRILQEALTNVRRYATGSTVAVTVRHSAERIELEIVNGPPPASHSSLAGAVGSGHGLVGIAERAALHGGWARTEETAEGGFRVQVRLSHERVPA